jgi:hypothetical protein
VKRAFIATLIIGLICIATIPLRTIAQAKSDPDAKIAELEEKLKQAKAIIERLASDARRARELPINVTQRKAITGSGQVVHIESISSKTLPVKVTLINPTFGKTNVFDLTIDPARITPSTKEIGHLEGWAGAPGDLIMLESQGFDPIRKRL